MHYAIWDFMHNLVGTVLVPGPSYALLAYMHYHRMHYENMNCNEISKFWAPWSGTVQRNWILILEFLCIYKIIELLRTHLSDLRGAGQNAVFKHLNLAWHRRNRHFLTCYVTACDALAARFETHARAMCDSCHNLLCNPFHPNSYSYIFRYGACLLIFHYSLRPSLCLADWYFPRPWETPSWFIDHQSSSFYSYLSWLILIPITWLYPWCARTMTHGI